MVRGRRLYVNVALFTLAATFGVAGLTKAQVNSPSADTKTNTMVPAYDLTKEVKVQGTIQKLDGFGTSGPIGTHILLQTTSGMVDAHLGFGAASSPKYLGIAAGQSVTVTGMMETIGGTNVLMARILTTSNHIFVLRNEHGIPVRAVPRGTLPAKSSVSPGFALASSEGSARSRSV